MPTYFENIFYLKTQETIKRFCVKLAKSKKVDLVTRRLVNPHFNYSRTIPVVYRRTNFKKIGLEEKSVYRLNDG